MNGERFRRGAWAAAAAALVALALVAAGCGGSSGADSSSASAAAGSSSGSDLNERLDKFSQCIREHGVPNFPDLRSVNGRIQFSLPPGVESNSPQFQQAMKACRSLSPQQNTQGSQSAGQQQQLLKFAKCMRKNGVPDFPDPTTGALMTGTGIDPNSPRFQSALQACQSLLPA